VSRLTVLSIVGQTPSVPDADLVVRAQRGDGWAEAALFRRHAPELLALATRLCGNAAEAEDIVQDTFVIVLEHMKELRDPAAFRAWLWRTAIRGVYRRSRRQALLRRLGIGKSDRVHLVPAPDASPEQRAQLGEIDTVLLDMPAALRIAWMLRFVEGCELTEVAAACGCSLTTAKRRLAAAQKRLRGVVEME
jgi:RNA polymerase sigma-70 factor, ECF subfamily